MTHEKFQGQTLSWQVKEGVIELALHREPCNEIGSLTLEELEKFAAALGRSRQRGSRSHYLQHSESWLLCWCRFARALQRSQAMDRVEALKGVRDFLERIHRVMNLIDAAPLTTIAAVHGVTFGGGFELALACDLIIADKMARFCFPELRLGLIPGFGGIPRLKRDLGNAVVRDLLLTGRSFNATKAQQIGLVSQVVGKERRCERRERRRPSWENSIARLQRLPNGSSSRSRMKSCGGKSRSSANYFRAQRCRPG